MQTDQPDILARNFWRLYAVAALGLLPALFYYYVGEEAIFPISSLEMWQRGTWLKQYLYGMDVQHNPLFNWLIMPLSALAGWKHVLIVTRALTVCATLITGLTVAWLTQCLFRNKAFAAFAALTYLTMADVLFYHGWLSYADPLFAMFIFAAVAALWAGVHERRNKLLFAAGMLLTCAFMTKALTAYLFYGAAIFVLLFDAQQRSFLFRWPSLFIHTATFAAPLGWFALIPSGSSQGGRMFAEILYKLAFPEMSAYFTRLITYPLEVFIWLSPATLLAAYFWVRHRRREKYSSLLRTAFWIALLEFLPYWISPKGGMRYLLPVYPLLALIAAHIIWQSGENARTIAHRWMIGAIVVNFFLALIVFPLYQGHYRGKNYDETAADILALSGNYPLYSSNASASGLSVTAYLDQRRYPAPAIQLPPEQWQTGYVLTLGPDEKQGVVFRKYQLGGDELYLLCRGDACAKER